MIRWHFILYILSASGAFFPILNFHRLQFKTDRDLYQCDCQLDTWISGHIYAEYIPRLRFAGRDPSETRSPKLNLHS